MIKKAGHVPPCFNAQTYSKKRAETLDFKEKSTVKTTDIINKNYSSETTEKVIAAMEKRSCKIDNNNSIYTLIVIFLLLCFAKN